MWLSAAAVCRPGAAACRPAGPAAPGMWSPCSPPRDHTLVPGVVEQILNFWTREILRVARFVIKKIVELMLVIRGLWNPDISLQPVELNYICSTDIC